MLNTTLAEITAKVFPWIEFLIGIFLVFGLWLRFSLRGALFLFFTFIVVVGQALIRELPILECGCFGELISFPLHIVFKMDVIFFFITFLLLRKLNRTSRFSLDQYFQDHL